MFHEARQLNPRVTRIARITAVHFGRGTCQIAYLDSPPSKDRQEEVAIPVAYAGRGWGYLAGVEEGTYVTVASGYNDKPHITGTIATAGHFNPDLGLVAEARFDSHPYRPLEAGTICMQSKGNSIVEARKNGDIFIQNTSGDTIRLNEESRILCQDSLQIHSFTDASKQISGMVMRDVRPTDRKFPNEGKLLNRVTDPDYDQFLQPIGKNPLIPTMHLQRGEFKRNPALAEVREVVYEFCNSFNTDNEVEIDGRTYQPPRTDGRVSTRANVLKANNNEIIETVKGTLVDVNGRILDLNRQPIPFSLNDTKEKLQEKLLKSVAFHMEMNSRRAINSSLDPRRFSKFSIDVDKEGQTKVNIPASSPFGNVPRFMDIFSTDNDPETGEELDERKTDPSVVEQEGGLIYHALSNVGRRLLYSGTEVEDEIGFNKYTELDLSEEIEVEPQPVTHPSAPGYTPEGHSLQLKLDGALFTSIGRNEQDQNSIVMDTAGKVVYHFGADEYGRSAIYDMDGSFRMNIGMSDNILKPLTPSERLSLTGIDLFPTEDEEDEEGTPFISSISGPGNSARVKTDGSVELYLGSDSATDENGEEVGDGKSLLLQSEGLVALNLGTNDRFNSAIVHTQGSLDLQLGSSLDGHSLGMQTEGSVIWNIGGGSSPLDGEESSIPGKLDIRVAGTVGGTALDGAQRFVVDTQGITLSADGNITLDTRGTDGTGMIQAVSQSEMYFESLGGGITIKALGLSNPGAGIVLDCPSGIMLKSGPNYINVNPAGIFISMMPFIQPSVSADTSPSQPSLNEEIER